MRAHAELAGAMARASFYLYPTNFPETSCIALMQVRDSLPIIPDPTPYTLKPAAFEAFEFEAAFEAFELKHLHRI
jgi:hypothetical protein